MISRRSKWLISGFAVGLVSFVVWQILAFGMLRQLQKVNPQDLQAQFPELLKQSAPLKYGPPLLLVFYVGCLFAVLALISLILDNRRKS
jgi:hypothetical protein